MAWLTYCVFTILLCPALKAVPHHFGPDFGVVITPLVLLAILSALAIVIEEYMPMPEKASNDGSISGALHQFFYLIIHPVINAIKELKGYVFVEKWYAQVIPLILITITATFGIQRIWGSRSKKE